MDKLIIFMGAMIITIIMGLLILGDSIEKFKSIEVNLDVYKDKHSFYISPK